MSALGRLPSYAKGQQPARTGHSLFDQIRLHQIKYATRTLEIFTMNKFSFFKISTETKVQVYPLGKQGLLYF